MRASSPEPFEARAYVDTGPVQERVYAQHAGLGWIGKNTLRHQPRARIVGLPWRRSSAACRSMLDAPAFDQCGTCTLCLEACPTQAFVAPGVLDATRCVSYLTIEHRGRIPDGAAPAIGDRMSTAATSARKSARGTPSRRVSTDAAWQPRPVWDRVDLVSLSRRATPSCPRRRAAARCDGRSWKGCDAISPSPSQRLQRGRLPYPTRVGSVFTRSVDSTADTAFHVGTDDEAAPQRLRRVSFPTAPPWKSSTLPRRTARRAICGAWGHRRYLERVRPRADAGR